MSTHQPHCSPTLVHLHRVALASAWVLALALIVQTAVFGFVHFTQARLESPAAVDVSNAPPPKVVLSRPASDGASEDAARQIRIESTKEQATAAPALSHWNGVMGRFSDLASGIGLIAAAFFVLHVALGVAVAAGANLPGADRVVRSAAWAATVMLVCAPWRDVFSSMPFTGVFCGYAALTAMSDASRQSSGDWGVIFNSGLLPAAALFAAVWATVQFRLGVDAGMIVTHLSQIDERIQNEIRETASRGVGSNVGSRSLGSLNAAIGSNPPPMRTADDVEAAKIARGLARGETLKKAAGGEGQSRRPI